LSFWDSLENHGDRPAFITGGEVLSYAEVAVQADTFCKRVQALLPDNVARPLIMVEAMQASDSIIAYLGALRAHWPVILVAQGTAAQGNQIFNTYQPNIVLRCVEGQWSLERVASEPVQMHPDLAVLLSTSGTTGAAKLVRLSQQNIEANARSIATYLEVHPDDRALTLLPFHYSYGMSVLHVQCLTGGALVLTEGSVTDPHVRDLARVSGVTSLAMVPTQFELIDDLSWVPELRYITQAGGRIDPLLATRFAEMSAAEGWRFYIMYGQTEASPRISYLPPQDALLWSHTTSRVHWSIKAQMSCWVMRRPRLSWGMLPDQTLCTLVIWRNGWKMDISALQGVPAVL